MKAGPPITIRGVRRLTILLVALALPAPAYAADAVSLAVTPGLVQFDRPATLVGTATPALAGEPVTILAGSTPVWTGITEVDGSFSATITVRRAGSYVAAIGPVQSAPAYVRVKPVVRAGLRGRRVLGGRVRVIGRVLPHQAGRVVVRAGDRTYRARANRSGRFTATFPAPGPGRVTLAVELRPKRGYVRVSRRIVLRVRARALRLGSRGEAVTALERRLASLRYTLRGIDRLYAEDTRDAVLAFQKVHGLARTGRVDARLWRALRGARTPAPRYRGTHVEVYKGRQVVFEVRNSRVVGITHVSTGATGNTPLGTWQVYRKVNGWDWVLWYPLYFLRGFALHGYPSVPAYPASHGCVRLPMWFAPGFHARWSHGATVRIFP
jgi:peptidoglycan hydrolase-like protein with peptidoglycan-binding domain